MTPIEYGINARRLNLVVGCRKDKSNENSLERGEGFAVQRCQSIAENGRGDISSWDVKSSQQEVEGRPRTNWARAGRGSTLDKIGVNKKMRSLNI